jgi:hypothetical protein
MSDGEESLFTGWGPDAPAGDTILRAFLLNWGDACSDPAEAMGARVLRRGDLVATDFGRPAGYLNCATLLRPLGSGNLDEVLATLDGFYDLAGGVRTGMVVIFSPWPTPDLRPSGWRPMGHPPFHVLPSGRTAPPVPPGLRIERVGDEAGLRAWEATAVAGYPLPDLEPLLPGAVYDARVLGDERLRFWIGWQDDRAVAVSAAFVAHGLTDVMFVATRPEARRRGFGAALTWQAAVTEPGLPAVLLSDDLGRPIYDRMGFLPLFRFTLWFRDRPVRAGSGS